ncbi:hypothetical protein QUF75_16880 [Desulfococcaceae bacterium HSG7]|nr:hypothetical protein [Desulfococcaceae bacterium HSG7]
MDFFAELANAFVKSCGTSLKRRRTDSFFIHGWIKLLSRYGLFKETIKKFSQALRKQKTGLYNNIKDDLSQPRLEKNFDITEKNKEETQRKISAMAKDMYKLIVTFENHKQVGRYETFKLLLKIFGRRCELKEEVKGSPETIIKDKPDAGAACGTHTPEAGYIRKHKRRVTGFKGFVTETCSEENETQFITDINVEKAGAGDSG